MIVPLPASGEGDTPSSYKDEVPVYRMPVDRILGRTTPGSCGGRSGGIQERTPSHQGFCGAADLRGWRPGVVALQVGGPASLARKRRDAAAPGGYSICMAGRCGTYDCLPPPWR